MNTTENKPQTTNIDEAIQTVAARVKAEYSVSLEKGEPSVQMIIDAIESGDEGEVEYVAQDLARDEGNGSELYEPQAEVARNGFNPLQDAEQADGEEEI